MSPVLLLTDTPPTPPYSRKTRSSGAKRDDGKSTIPGLTDNTVSDDDLDIEYIDDSVGEAWWHMRQPGANIPGAPDGWSPPGIPEKMEWVQTKE